MAMQEKREHKLKYNIQGFNQLEAIKLGLNNDDLTVLRWFIDFKNTGKIDKKYIKKVNDMGHWVDYATLIDSLPILLKDGNKYLEEYIELEKIYYIDEKSYKELRKKFMEKYKKRIQRILSGNLSKVLKRDITKIGENKGTKVYLYVNEIEYRKLVSDTNMNDLLRDNGIINNIQDKSVHHTMDKSVHHTMDKSVHRDSSTNDSSTNDSSTTQSTQNVSVVETNKELIESKTHLLLDSKNKKDKISKWDKDRLLKALDIFVEQEGQYFSLLEKIYKDDKNFIPKKTKKIETRFHNINQTFTKYTPEELEDLLKENQKRKFAKEKELEMKKTSFHNFTPTMHKYNEYELNNLISRSQKNKFDIDGTLFMSDIKITNELINKCIEDEDYFYSLSENTKYDIKKYMIENNKFIPLHISNL